jgi:hypothetical protein
MRLACGIAIVLGLNFQVARAVSSQHAPPAGANTTTQVPATSGANEGPPVQQPPTETSPAAAKKLPATATAKHRKHVTAPAAPPGAPKKIVVREGGASEPAAQIAPGMTPTEAMRQRQNAEQWLESTDQQLKQIAGRKLEAAEQETVGQIHNYVEGARSALKENDVRRASTLAEKAHLLTDDLMRR